jgi:hypothetical protein
MSNKNQEFIIKFEGVNLSKEASMRIQNGINDLLLQELAGHQPGGSVVNDDNQSDDYCGVYIPHKWIGRQIIPVNFSRPDTIKVPGSTLAFVANLNERL